MLYGATDSQATATLPIAGQFGIPVTPLPIRSDFSLLAVPIFQRTTNRNKRLFFHSRQNPRLRGDRKICVASFLPVVHPLRLLKSCSIYTEHASSVNLFFRISSVKRGQPSSPYALERLRQYPLPHPTSSAFALFFCISL